MVRLQGQCELDKLEKVIQIVVRRHEALHLRFSPDGTYQEKTKPQTLDLPHTDISGLSSADQEQALQDIFKRVGSTPFDLVNGPIIRIEIVTCSDTEHVMVVTCHHIVCDGWSWNVLLQEMGTVYGALCTGMPYRLDKAFQYSTYVMAELQRQTDDSVQRSYNYWLKQFEDLPSLVELPTDRPRPALKAYTGGTVSHHFRPQIYTAVKEAAAEQKVSLFAYLYSAFNLMLARLSGQNDVVVTVPAAGQLNVGKKTLVGYCVNLLPVRAQVDLDGTFAEAVKAARSTVLDAYDHQDSTYSGIVHRMALPRDLSRLPLSEINFNVDRDDAGVEFGGLNVEVAHTPKEAVFSDIFFNINEYQDGFKVDCDFNHALFDHSTIERWIQTYEYILAQVAANPTSALSAISLLPPDARNETLISWNNTQAEYQQDAALHELFEQQAAKTPNATAILYENQNRSIQSVTYQELNERANQLANYLISQGLVSKREVSQNIVHSDSNSDTLIGLCLERSVDMMVGLLGILKSGAGYVPMDPMFPEERLLSMVEDAAPATIITEKQFSSYFTNVETDQLLIDEDWATIASESNTTESSVNPEQVVQPHDLAYVIYTSGSTGKPKGVQIPHRAVSNFLASMAKEPGLTGDDTILAVTTISFDISVLELFLPLTVGASAIIASQEMSMDADWIISKMSQATVMQATPATWQMLLSTGWTDNSGLRILVGGEALSRELADQLLERCDELWNMYGPTETTIWSSVQRVDAVPVGSGGANENGQTEVGQASVNGIVSIGRPIANTQLYILDSNHQPLPIGVVGDLYIGGHGLARGYRNRPELTAEKFINNPFADSADNNRADNNRADNSTKLYNTGDLARYNADGTVDFLGRSDFQVKIRGFRIELGEIESVLQQHPEISEAVVTAWEETPSSRYLVGYLKTGQTASEDSLPTITELRDYLRERLPEYMVPSNFVFMDGLPLTPNGKVDRKALPQPESQRPTLDDAFVAPQTPNEEAVAQIWREILSIDEIGIHDNFFDLGGHSLQATRVLARLRDMYHLELNLRTFFGYPTVHSMAEHITQKLVESESEEELLEMIQEVQDLSEEELKALLED